MRAPAAEAGCDSAAASCVAAPEAFAPAPVEARGRGDDAAPRGVVSVVARTRRTARIVQFPFHRGADPGAASAASPRPAPRKPS